MLNVALTGNIAAGKSSVVELFRAPAHPYTRKLLAAVPRLSAQAEAN